MFARRGRSIALLAAFAVVAMGFVSAEARENDAGRPSDAYILKRIQEYRSYDIDNSCAVNSLLFEDWFKREFPESYITRIAIETRDPNLGHEMPVFDVGAQTYAWDFVLGAMPVRSGREDRGQLIRAATRTYHAVSGYNGNSLSRARPGPIDQIHVNGSSVASLIYDLMKGRRPAAVIEYQGEEYVVFQVGNTINAFTPSRGTLRGTLVGRTSPVSGLSHLLRDVVGGSGEHIVTKGGLLSMVPLVTRSRNVMKRS